MPLTQVVAVAQCAQPRDPDGAREHMGGREPVGSRPSLVVVHHDCPVRSGELVQSSAPCSGVWTTTGVPSLFGLAPGSSAPPPMSDSTILSACTVSGGTS